MRPVALVVFAGIIVSCGPAETPAEPEYICPEIETILMSRTIPTKQVITKIGLSRNGCEGVCPVRAFLVDSSLVFNYFGGLYAEPEGYFTGRSNKDDWQELVRLTEEIKAVGVPQWQLIYDCPEYELVAIAGSDTLHAQGCASVLGLEISTRLDTMLFILERPRKQNTRSKLEFVTWIPGPLDR